MVYNTIPSKQDISNHNVKTMFLFKYPHIIFVGLSMIFNVDQDEYVGDFADSAGECYIHYVHICFQITPSYHNLLIVI